MTEREAFEGRLSLLSRLPQYLGVNVNVSNAVCCTASGGVDGLYDGDVDWRIRAGAVCLFFCHNCCRLSVVGMVLCM